MPAFQGRGGVGSTVSSAEIEDDSIVNADVNSSAAIVLTKLATSTSAQLKTLISDETGSGKLAFATSPTLITPVLGTPASGTLTSCTGLPITGITSATSAQIATLCSNETGSGLLVFGTSPTLITPVLGTPASGALTNCTALPAAQVTQGTMASGMVLVAPVLGTPASGALTNCTALPAAQVTAGTMASGHIIPDPTLTFSINAQTGTSYTPVLADAGKIITISNGSAIAVTIPPNSGVAFPIGSSLTFISIGAGLTTIGQGSGVTIASVGGTATAPIITAQHNSATAIKIATDTWQVVGALT